MAKLVFIFYPLFLFLSYSHSLPPFLEVHQAVVQVYQAPLKSGPSVDSANIQWVSKGQKLVIHSEYNQKEQAQSPKEQDFFYKTIDHSGNPAYIQAQYLQILSKDHKEIESSRLRMQDLKSNRWQDPTDHRLKQ